MPTTIADIAKSYRQGERIAMVTCYDYSSALLVTRAGLDFILVGDSLGQVMLCHADTVAVTLEDIAHHARAVVRGAPEALIVADLPFMTYGDCGTAVQAAKYLAQAGGVRAIKIEGGRKTAPVIEHLTAEGMPVMGHLGFTPQSAYQIGIKVQAKSAKAAATLIDDARALEAAGAFAIVLELVPAELAAAVTEQISIPTIGIGAGPGCSGQVQVWHDLLGLGSGPSYRHAKRYTDAGDVIVAALSRYAQEVRNGLFPTNENASTMSATTLQEALQTHTSQ
jgi:3-methyl-2-oxobutanoate hydroxymethyltransferase